MSTPLRCRAGADYRAGGVDPQGAAFSSPPVVSEHVTRQLVERGADEIERGELALLASQPLVKARAKDYVRRTQARPIAAPLSERVAGRTGGPEAAAQRLVALLGQLRSGPAGAQGFGPGNLVNLRRLVRGHPRGADVAGPALRRVILPEAEPACPVGTIRSAYASIASRGSLGPR